jgi:lysophospholipase L1-like esterase
MNHLLPSFVLGGAALLLGACIVASATVAHAEQKSAVTFVSASNNAFVYQGRIDRHNTEAPVLIWQGSTVRVAFTGDTLALVFGKAVKASFFDVEVDGNKGVVEVKPGVKTIRVACPFPLKNGAHELVLVKRSEADAGYATFLGLDLASGATVTAPKVPAYKLSVQFFGDSITAGACNEDGAADQWESYATHNGALSYAALTAAGINAQYRNTAVSGMGIIMGYVPKTARQIWDRLYPETGSAKADEAGFMPDVVFVNYGENDDSFSKRQGMPFPPEFTDGYVELIKSMRAAYPKAEIVLLRGGMSGGANSVPLREAWEAAVKKLEGGDAHVHHFVFSHWSALHPRVSDDRAMAAELVAWLKAQPFMQRWQ